MYTPHLRHKQEFERALQGYTISPESQRVLAATPLVVLVAATSSGRNTIINEICKTGAYHYVVSDTTRPPRLNKGVMEQNGQEYFFRAEDDMLADIKAGLYVEAAIIHDQQVSGPSIREIKKASDEHKIAISEVNVEGGATFLRLKPDTTLIFILPPNFKEWLERLRGRSNFEKIELYRRLSSAVHEYQAALESKHCKFVINDNLDEAVRDVDNIARHGIYDSAADKRGRELACDLVQATTDYIATYLADVIDEPAS